MTKYREKEGLFVITPEIQRISPNAVAIEAKVMGFYTNSYFNHEYFKEEGADEAREALRGLYSEATRGTLPRYDDWLTYVD